MKIEKKFLTDENLRPVAVLIDYEQWKQIEEALKDVWPEESVDLSPFVGTVQWPEDPMDYQRRIRAEWGHEETG